MQVSSHKRGGVVGWEDVARPHLISLGRWDAFSGALGHTSGARLEQSMEEGSKKACWTPENRAYAHREGKYLAKSPGDTGESAVL